MTYRIGHVDYANFGPFESVQFDFGLPGLTGIEGHISGTVGVDSNGSGKSMLFEGVSWALWGRCLRSDFRGDDIVRTGSKGGCAVSVEVVDPSGVRPLVKVFRYRKHPKWKNSVRLFVKGEDVTRGTDVQTQEAIHALLGMDFLSFCNSVAFGAREDVRSFYGASDADRKAILDRILGLELYAQAHRVARVRLIAQTKVRDDAKAQLASLQVKLQQAEKNLEMSPAQHGAENLKFQLMQRQLEVKFLGRAIAKREVQYGKALARLAVETKNMEALKAVRAQEVAEATQKRLKHQQAAQAALKRVSALQGQVIYLESRVKQLSKLEGDCPTCARAFAAKDRAVAQQMLQSEIDALSLAIEEPQKEWKEHNDRAARVVVPSALLAFPARDLEQAAVRVEKETLDYFQESLHAAEKVLAVLQQWYDEATQQSSALAAEVEHLQDGVKVYLETLASEDKKLAQLEFWVEGFGSNGVRSFLIEAEIPAINKLATGYARMLLGPGASVRLSATTALKSKDEVRERISIDAKVTGCCASYAAASKGQKRRLDLALLLAFRDLLSGRVSNPFEQFFADELFDGLDKAGCETIVEMLQALGNQYPVVLVTHSPWLKNAAARTVRVEHDGHYRATVQMPPEMLAPQKPPSGGVKKGKKKVASKLGG